MKCKNCGATVPKGSNLCINCGAVLNKSSVNFSDIPREEQKNEKKKHPGVKKAICIILSFLIILGAGATSFCLFYQKNMQRERPELDFSCGQGVINENESVVYVTVSNPSKLQYIHGVKLYEGDVAQNDIVKAKPVAENYKYTKNIDDSVRAIYFDLNDLGLKKGKNYTYTFEMTFGFYNDDSRYTYLQAINFAMSDNNVSDVIFDSTAAKTTAQQPAENADAEITNDYIYDNYWYSQPFKDENNRTAINSLKFSDDGTCTVTYYVLDEANKWTVTTYKGSFEIKDNRVSAKLDNGKSATLTLDSKARTLTPDKSDKSLTERKHNSVTNAEQLCK